MTAPRARLRWRRTMAAVALFAAAGSGLLLVGPVLAAGPSPQVPLAFPKPQEIVAVDHGEWAWGEKFATNPYMLASKDAEVSPGTYGYKDATGGLIRFFGHDIAGPYTNRTDLCPFILEHHLAGLGTGVVNAAIPTVTAEECAAAAGAPAAASPTASPSPEALRATTTSLSGDVEYSSDGGKTYQPLTVGTVIEKGFLVSTGFDGAIRLNFGYGDLSVPRLTTLRIDELTSSANLQKTQIFLRVGAIAVRERHTDAIRGDFSVSTETMVNASIRDSEMIVTYAKGTGRTTVYTVEDVAYVQGVKSAVETKVLQGQKVVVTQGGKLSKPAPYAAAELPSIAPFDPAIAPIAGSGAQASASGSATSATSGSGDTGGSNGGLFVAAVIAAIAVGAIASLLLLRTRARRQAGSSSS